MKKTYPYLSLMLCLYSINVLAQSQQNYSIQFPNAPDQSYTDSNGNTWTLHIPSTTVIGTLTFIPAASHQPIAFKGQGGGVFCDTSPCTFSYTVNSASNSLLVQVGGGYPPCWNATNEDDITSVTFNGVTMTQLVKRANNI